MSEPVPALVTLHLWHIAPAAVPMALVRMGRDRSRMRRTPGVRFAKLLGTGDGRTFTVRDADPLRWALLTSWTSLDAARAFERDSPLRAAWNRLAHETWRIDLRPLASRGTWSGREPFGDPTPVRTSGPVAALTRARLRPTAAMGFWRSVPPVSADLRDRPGLLAAIGIGEAPIGLQGTFSLWESSAAVREFARAPAHAAVVARTQPERWYAEELFARFDVLGSTGTLDGRDPLG